MLGRLQKKLKLNRDDSTVLLEICNILYNSCIKSAISALLVAGIVIYTFKSFISTQHLIIWSVIILSTYLTRHLVLLRIKSINRKSAGNSVHLNLNIFRVMTAICGLAWGSAGIFLFPADTENQAVLAIILAGIAGGAISAYAVDKITVFLFTSGIVLLTIPNFLLNHSRLSSAMMTCIAIYIITIIRAELTSGKSVWENILLKHAERKIKEEINTAKEEIERLAYYDALTGLPNRRLLIDRATLALAKSDRKKTHCCLMFIDLDNFKALNDTYGHAAGDLLLMNVAKRLKEVLRPSDTVARIGGDEFVLLIEDIDQERMQALVKSSTIGQKLVDEINKPFLLEEITYSCSPSIGICLFSDEKLTTDELLNRADAAMYQAKQSGKGKYYHYDEEIQKIVNNKAELKRSLQKAIDHSLFLLNFQPQINADRKIIGAEALLRLVIDGKNISPVEFIPAAEETKLIIPIGTWVLEQACQQLYRWQQSESIRDLKLSVNVSALQFSQSNFVQEVERIVTASKCNPVGLTLELTESTVIQNFDDVVSKMHALKRYGISLSMDDFGTGYSSLSVLKKLPLHEVKIDRSFVFDLAENQDSAVIVQSIIAMTISLGLNIIAEGVETEEQVSLLLNAGCRHFQGYLFGRPVTIEQFENVLMKQNQAV